MCIHTHEAISRARAYVCVMQTRHTHARIYEGSLARAISPLLPLHLSLSFSVYIAPATMYFSLSFFLSSSLPVFFYASHHDIITDEHMYNRIKHTNSAKLRVWSTYLGIVMHLVLQLCVVMAFSSSSRPADFLSFLTRLLTAFSLHLSSLSAFFQPSSRLTIGGLKLGSIEVIICPETSARDPHRGPAPTASSSRCAYGALRSFFAARPRCCPRPAGDSADRRTCARARVPNTDRDSLAGPVPRAQRNHSLSHADNEYFATAAIMYPERAARRGSAEIGKLRL